MESALKCNGRFYYYCIYKVYGRINYVQEFFCVRKFSIQQSDNIFKSSKPETFKLQRALIVSKLSWYEVEQLKYPNLNKKQLEDMITQRGTNIDCLMQRHHLHKEFERKIIRCFQDAGCEVKLATRLELRTSLSKDVMHWPDIIVPIGGDGTFLLTAGRSSPLFAQSAHKIPIVGFNSDPKNSAGRLMLPQHYSENPRDAVSKIKSGDFQWIHRSRVRTTLLSNNGVIPESADLYRHTVTKMEQEHLISEYLTKEECSKYKAKMKRTLPYLALNEVFIGETQSSRVTHLHLVIDNEDVVNKTKCSGMCVTTGTGSTSWHTSINRLTKRHIEDLCDVLSTSLSKALKTLDIDDLITKYNQNLIFPPDDLRLCYSIREQICVAVWPSPKEFEARKFVKKLFVTSHCTDANLVIDGSICYPFNDGNKALLEIYPEDALLAIALE